MVGDGLCFMNQGKTKGPASCSSQAASPRCQFGSPVRLWGVSERRPPVHQSSSRFSEPVGTTPVRWRISENISRRCFFEKMAAFK